MQFQVSKIFINMISSAKLSLSVNDELKWADNDYVQKYVGH
jgi:hypothetical protein